VDTGGIDMSAEDTILSQMREQAGIAIDAADVILYFVDAKQGLIAEDYEVADMLRRTDKPVITVVNKADNQKDELASYDFYALGLGEVMPISAGQGLGIGDLLDAVAAHFGEYENEEEKDTFKIAFVGKPNVGKSSLTNKILGENRTIVSDVPGTTRDAIDTDFEMDGTRYTLIDTAGMRKKGRIEGETIERYSVIRSLSAIRRADVVVVMIDATESITEQDVKIAGYVDYEGKSCVIAVNKWDSVIKDTYTSDKFNKVIDVQLTFMPYAKRVYLSAKTGQRIDKLFDLAREAKENGEKRITTGLLNDCLRDAVTAVPPPTSKGRRLKVFYTTQASVRPPTFILFVNDTELLHFSYKRYLENYLRKTFDFSGTPIRFVVRQRNEAGEK
jgi:GTP-binding protein